MTKMDALMTAMNMMMQTNENGEYADAIDTLGKMIDQLATANSRPKPKTQRQKDNETLSGIILGLLTSEPMPCADVVVAVQAQGVEFADPITSARVASLLTGLVKAGAVVKSEGKGGKTLYSLPVGE